MKTPINMSDVLLTPAVCDRWRQYVLNTSQQFAAAGITLSPDVDEEMFLVDGGRLMISVQIQPGFSIALTAEKHEWARRDSN